MPVPSLLFSPSTLYKIGGYLGYREKRFRYHLPLNMNHFLRQLLPLNMNHFLRQLLQL